MYVAGLQTDPVHGRQVAYRVADLCVLDQLRLARRTGGEVQQQGVVGGGVDPMDRAVVAGRVGVLQPALDRIADGDADAVVGDSGVPSGVGAGGDHRTDVAAGDAVGQVCVGQQRGRGDHHRTGTD